MVLPNVNLRAWVQSRSLVLVIMQRNMEGGYDHTLQARRRACDGTCARRRRDSLDAISSVPDRRWEVVQCGNSTRCFGQSSVGDGILGSVLSMMGRRSENRVACPLYDLQVLRYLTVS